MEDQEKFEEQPGKRKQIYEPVVTSRELFCGSTKLFIDHDGEIYHLSVTRQGKLILTK